MKKHIYLHGLLVSLNNNIGEYMAMQAFKKHTAKDIKIKRNLEYGKANKERLSIIDTSEHYKNNKLPKKPLMLYIHGGGWVSGIYKMRESYCSQFVHRGFVVANIDYSNAPQKRFPHQLKQLFKAIDFLYDNSEKYNIDMSKVLIAGDSAGAYFACYIAQLTLSRELFKKIGINFNHINDFKVSALISNCGSIDIVRLSRSKFHHMQLFVQCFTGLELKDINKNSCSEKIKLLSPQFTKGFPPSFIIYGKNDLLRFETYAMAKKFSQLTVPHRIFKGTGLASIHASAIATFTPQGKDCLKQTLDFILPYFDLGNEAVD